MMNPVELHAIWMRNDGSEEVHTGIYLPDTMTIRDVRNLMMMYESDGNKAPDKVEFKVKEEEE